MVILNISSKYEGREEKKRDQYVFRNLREAVSFAEDWMFDELNTLLDPISGRHRVLLAASFKAYSTRWSVHDGRLTTARKLWQDYKQLV